jgi:hypothetical protein
LQIGLGKVHIALLAAALRTARLALEANPREHRTIIIWNWFSPWGPESYAR